MIELGGSLSIIFIDCSTTFDTISHKFLDETLESVRAPVKIRSLFRTMYIAVSTSFADVLLQMLYTLGYSDDVMIIEYGNTVGVSCLSERVLKVVL